jgi:ADP-ribose pyrophosphatase YjhB (NUDIX family)
MDEKQYNWLSLAQRIQAISQAGLTFTRNKYDVDRYEQLREISVEIMQEFTDAPQEKIRNLFASEKGYQTPKVDVRGVVFRENKILMVREGIDGKWSIPGGWADVCKTPFEIAEKEVWEEAGIHVKPIRILAVLDKRKHPHPPDPWHSYKLFILCEDQGGEPKPGMETLDARFVGPDEIPVLSEERTTHSQIDLMFEFLRHQDKQTVCD